MRLFVAVGFPEEVRERAWRATAPLREADFPVRWVGAGRLHLTLEFLGETPEGRLRELRATLDGVAARVPPLELRLRGVGGFPSLAAPRVLWLGVEGPPALLELQRSVEEGMAALGYEPEARNFHPHVTLGRARRGSRRGAFEGLEEVAGRVELDASCRVERVELMESVLRPDGARYSVVSSHPFGGGPGATAREVGG